MDAPALVLFSPWVRTRETAEIIAAAFNHTQLREFDALRPGSTVPAVEDALGLVEHGPRGPGHIVLVSHQPLVSQLVSHFLGPGSRVPALSPGSLVTFTLEAVARDCGELRFWAAPPGYEAGI